MAKAECDRRRRAAGRGGSAACGPAVPMDSGTDGRGASGSSAMTAASVKHLASTDAASITERSTSSSRSRRAARSAWIVAGTSSVRPPGRRPTSSRERRPRSAARTSPRQTTGCPRLPRRCARRARSARPAPPPRFSELCALGLRERLQQRSGRVELSPAPAGADLEQFGSRQTHEQHRGVARRVWQDARRDRETSARPSAHRRRRPPAVACAPGPRTGLAPRRSSPRAPAPTSSRPMIPATLWPMSSAPGSPASAPISFDRASSGESTSPSPTASLTASSSGQ